MNPQSLIRSNIIFQRNQLDVAAKRIDQSLFNQKLLEFISDFSSVALYCAVKNEISVACVYESAPVGCRLALPRINEKNELIFVDYESPDLWRAGMYDIPEPTTEIINYIPELFIIPLTAIDRQGTRVGMGKGYYDRYLAGVSESSILLGVGWDFQLIDEVIDRQQHDIAMDYFISPSHFIKY